VVALQIHDVSEPTRRILSAAARARRESLQEFLLELLEREAQQIDGRGLLEVEPTRLLARNDHRIRDHRIRDHEIWTVGG
jgi:uncharacterized protein (DUF1778 family)